MAKVAPNLFTGEAIDWWMGRQAIHQDEDMPWTEFRKLFLEKYVPLTYRNQMKMEFLRLEQGTDSVSVYVQKFDTYARYAPEYVSNEADRIWKFCEGLKTRLHPYVVSAGGRTYAEVVEKALVQERIEQAAIREASRGTGRQGSGQYRPFRKPGENTRGTTSVSRFGPSPYGQKKRKI